MASLHVEKVRDSEATGMPVIDAIERMLNDTRRRAFELFQRRGCTDGGALDDWLSAERELLSSSPAELIEDERQFRLQVAVPGLDPNNLRITAMPHSIVVRAEAAHHHDKCEGRVHFCEFSERRLLRTFDLHAPIDVDRVSAALDKGMLVITAAKAAKPEHGRPVRVNAAA
jgi:HSP20 family molecular chaperone IbpA